MKITPDTKVKDLIPEGYEIDYNSTSFPSGSTSIVVPIKRCQDKDFEWYYGEYLKRNRECLARWLTRGANDYSYDLFVGENYKEIEFEIKIGLLKFICDDLGIGLLGMYSFLKTYHMDSVGEAFEGIKNIIPEEFLDSLT